MSTSKFRGAAFGPLLAVAGALLSAACSEPKTAADAVPVGTSRAMGGTTYRFSLAESPDVKKKVEDTCAAKTPEDEKAKADCVQLAAKVSAGEGMRFVRPANAAKWTWLAFGTDKDGKELVYNQFAFSILRGDDPGKLSIRPEGQDRGLKALNPLPTEIIFDMPNDATVILFDPNRGKLVFKKEAPPPAQ